MRNIIYKHIEVTMTRNSGDHLRRGERVLQTQHKDILRRGERVLKSSNSLSNQYNATCPTANYHSIMQSNLPTFTPTQPSTQPIHININNNINSNSNSKSNKEIAKELQRTAGKLLATGNKLMRS